LPAFWGIEPLASTVRQAQGCGMAQGRSARTEKNRQVFLDTLAATGNVTAAAKAVSLDRNAAYSWRRTDAAFAREWDAAVDAVMDAIEAKAIHEARYENSAAAAQSRLFLLRTHRPEVYNPAQLLIRERLKVELEIRKLELARLKATPLVIEGKVEAPVATTSVPGAPAMGEGLNGIFFRLPDNKRHLPDPDAVAAAEAMVEEREVERVDEPKLAAAD
jgi:hypothetical protein